MNSAVTAVTAMVRIFTRLAAFATFLLLTAIAPLQFLGRLAVLCLRWFAFDRRRCLAFLGTFVKTRQFAFNQPRFLAFLGISVAIFRAGINAVCTVTGFVCFLPCTRITRVLWLALKQQGRTRSCSVRSLDKLRMTGYKHDVTVTCCF